MNSAQILVVDDEAAVRESLRRALALEGYDVELAADGAEALYRLDVGEVQPDAIVLDVLMPNVDGLETARRLRGAGNRIPILMLTARDEVEARVAGLDAGADDYVVKPFALAELLARLRAWPRRSRSRSWPLPSSSFSSSATSCVDRSTAPSRRGPGRLKTGLRRISR